MKPHAVAMVALLFLNVAVAHAVDPLPHQTPAQGTDKRVTLNLTAAERAMILEEMHVFLEGVQKITGSLARQDMQATADAARKLGRALAHDVPPALRAKLPQEFRQLGALAHADFDQIAMDAESLQDVSHSLNQLSDTLTKCVSCHTMYQVQTSRIPKKQ